jgi:hypothetical protein
VGHRSWAKANNPYWSNNAATWYAGHQSVEEYCRRRDISTTPFKRWARHLLSSEDLHKRKKRLQNLRAKQLERQGKKARSKPRRRTFTYRYNMRTDSDTIAVRAFAQQAAQGALPRFVPAQSREFLRKVWKVRKPWCCCKSHAYKSFM